MSNRLVQLRKDAPDSVTVAQGTNPADVFYGPLTKVAIESTGTRTHASRSVAG